MSNAKRLTKTEARAYVKRWRRVNDAEILELRATSPEVKFRQLAAMMASVDAMGWREALSEGDQEVRERWRRLRMRHEA